MHRHTADNISSLAQSNTGRMELALILCVSVTVDSDDADRRARCVGDDDWLGQRGAGAGWCHTTAAEQCCSGYTPVSVLSTSGLDLLPLLLSPGLSCAPPAVSLLRGSI